MSFLLTHDAPSRIRGPRSERIHRLTYSESFPNTLRKVTRYIQIPIPSVTLLSPFIDTPLSSVSHFVQVKIQAGRRRAKVSLPITICGFPWHALDLDGTLAIEALPLYEPSASPPRPLDDTRTTDATHRATNATLALDDTVAIAPSAGTVAISPSAGTLASSLETLSSMVTTDTDTTLDDTVGRTPETTLVQTEEGDTTDETLVEASSPMSNKEGLSSPSPRGNGDAESSEDHHWLHDGREHANDNAPGIHSFIR